MNLLAGKVAIVTGASKGIGAGIAKAFCAKGAYVVVHYTSSKQTAERVLAELAEVRCNAITVQASVSDPEDVERTITFVSSDIEGSSRKCQFRGRSQLFFEQERRGQNRVRRANR